jgi:hypothetical protein
VGGVPSGHFVVLADWREETREVCVADPWQREPVEHHSYSVGVHRLINAILLGVLTYDGNLLVLEPRGARG